METKEDILKELLEIAPKLAAMDKTNPYVVPEGYFMNFKNVMLERVVNPVLDSAIHAELKTIAPALAKIEKHVVADMPVNYFNDFSARLLKKINSAEVANELAEIAPALSIIEKPVTVTLSEAEGVPAHYFSSFPSRMMKLVHVEQKENVSFASPFLEALNNVLEKALNLVAKPRYTVAFAGFATVLLLAVMMLVKVQPVNDIDNQLAQLTTEEINNYLDNKSDAYSEEIFEANFDEKVMTPAEKMNAVHVYNDALKDVDDATLNDAIAD